MGTSDLNFYINKHRKAYEERLKREQQNQQGKPSEGEPGREVEKAPPSEVTNGGANEQPIETDSRSKNPNEEFSQHASQSDATRNSTREEHMNQGELLWEETNEVDADYLLALKLNEALNGHVEPPSVVNENQWSSGSHARSAEKNEDAEDDVRKPDNSYVECLLGDNNYMPFCVNYNVGSAHMNQNPLPPGGRNRRGGHYVDHDEGGQMYGPYNLRSRSNRVNGLQSSNQSGGNGDDRYAPQLSGGNDDRRYSPHFSSAHEPLNISISSDDEEGEVQVKNVAAKSYLSQDDGVRSGSDVFYVHDENLSLTPRQGKPSGQGNLGRPVSTRGEDSKGEVTIVEGTTVGRTTVERTTGEGSREGRFSNKGAHHHEQGDPDVYIQTLRENGGEMIPRVMGNANNFSFQSVGAQSGGGGDPLPGQYNNCGGGLQVPKCTVEKAAYNLGDVYNDHFGFSNGGPFQPLQSAATEVGHPSGSSQLRGNYVDASPNDEYTDEGRYYAHYERMNLHGKEKEKNKLTIEGVYDVDAYGEGVHNGSLFPSRGRNRNGGKGTERAKNGEGEYYMAQVHGGNDVIPLEGEDLSGGAPSPYKARAKKSRRGERDTAQVESIHSDEGLSHGMVQPDGAPQMGYTMKSSGKPPTNEKIEDPYCCKGESYEAPTGRGLEVTHDDGLVLFKTGLGRRGEPQEGTNSPTMGGCNRGGRYPKSGLPYADVGGAITQGEPSPFGMLPFEKGNPVERSANGYLLNNAMMHMDDSAKVFAEMASMCAPAQKSSRGLPFESLHPGGGASAGPITSEGGLHSRTNEQTELFSGSHVKSSGRAFTLNQVEDNKNVILFHCKDGGLSEGAPHALPNYVEGGKSWSGAPRGMSNGQSGVYFHGEVSSSSSRCMVEPPPPRSEFLQRVEINRGADYQGKAEEKNKGEGPYGHVVNGMTPNRFSGSGHNKYFASGKSPVVYTLGEAQGGAAPDVYVIDEGTTSGEPHFTHGRSVYYNPMGGYRQGMIPNEDAHPVGDVQGESAGSVKVEEAEMEQVQRGGDANDNTTSAIDQCDEESANDEDLSVQQAIINSLIDL
ncbi:hypothetical protein PVNG_01079 [Plasmodium vivax North Korean]|uniref:Uncharacterized protein n=1 Tax=Plasmodium vivax North Korean TaxID=1035514 RepID=A0A0J9TXN9_PLAVI|nr:hypothetical protein PVNG_01079 [Plasmodium vivax North Korean]